MSDNYTSGSDQGERDTRDLEEKTIEALNRYIQTTNHAVAHVAATHDRALLDRL